MSGLGDFFDAIYCVNLDDRTDRWEHCTALFAKHGLRVERLSAIDGRSGRIPPNEHMSGTKIACCRSHAKLLATALERGHKRFLVLEDDVDFVDDLGARFEQVLRELPDDWELLYLGGNHKAPLRPMSRLLGRCVYTLCNSSVGWTRSMAERALPLLLQETGACDTVIAGQQKTARAYATLSPLAWQIAGRSDIEGRYIDYDHMRASPVQAAPRPSGPERSYDVVLYDECSSALSPRRADVEGVGGVEWSHMLLADALSREGEKVLVLSSYKGCERYDGDRSGSIEYGHVSRVFEERISCGALIVSRWSRVPATVEAERVVFSEHDIPETWMYDHQRPWLDDGAPMVCVSPWLAHAISDVGADWRRTVGDWRRVVIPPMMLDECYAPIEDGEKQPTKFVYASAALKGLTPSLDVWGLIREHFPETLLAELFVATNGYDDPSLNDSRRMDAMGVRPLGRLPARAIIRELRSAAGLFYVNSYSETFSMIGFAAMALGCRTHVLCLGNPGALPETLRGSRLVTTSKHDFIEDFARAYVNDADWAVPPGEIPDLRARALLPRWTEVLYG